MDLLKDVKNTFQRKKVHAFSLTEYLDMCKADSSVYASAAERMIKAIGQPVKVDTSADSSLSRIFNNRTIMLYPTFNEFYGMEDTIERIVAFFKHSAQGLEESKQILYLLGPVGSAKSSLAEKLKLLMEQEPMYVLRYKEQMSPVFESVFGLLSYLGLKDQIVSEYGVPDRVFRPVISPWALKRLESANGDISDFDVVRVYPDRLAQIGISKTEPGDENNQDISTLVGKVDIRMLELYSQNDTDAYSYSGGLNRSNQGLLEFVEMFKAPIKCLHPLLTATQEGNYIGTENISSIPFNGIVLAHSNEAEWDTFKNNKNNEAFIDRICTIKVPYCLRYDAEKKIYEKMIDNSGLKGSPCAPETLEMLSKFCVLTRLVEPENSSVFSKLRIYNGESIKDIDNKAKSQQEYRDAAGEDEGMEGISTRFAFKVLSSTFNFDPEEVAADPVHLLYVLEKAIKREQFNPDRENTYMTFIKEHLSTKYAEYIRDEIQKAFLETYADFGQSQFEKYISYADAWIQQIDYKDSDTGQMFDLAALEKELEKIERPGNVINTKDFRSEVVNFVLRAERGGKKVVWTTYRKLAEVIEKKMFATYDELLPVISFSVKKDKETEKKHKGFVDRMIARGYTAKQVNRLVDWFVRFNKSN